jgi:ParB-like chromosome segregation protein Spo0J
MSADFHLWKERKLSVSSIQLDPLNPRIPGAGTGHSQRTLINELVEHDDVYDLAKSIVEQDYMAVELPICVKENNKYYVVEGNRRLTSLKILLNPGLIKNERLSKRFKSLAENFDVESVRKIKVYLAPSRLKASIYIRNKHTQKNFEKWSPVMQARFYKVKLDEGMSVQDIVNYYGISQSDVISALKMDEMYNLACTLDLDDSVMEVVRSPRNFPITNLERLYNNSTVLSFCSGLMLPDTI